MRKKIVALVGAVIMAVSLTACNVDIGFRNPNSSKNLNLDINESIDSDGIKDLDISINIGEVRISAIDGQDFTIVSEGRSEISRPIEIDKSGSTLSIKEENSTKNVNGFNNLNSSNRKITIGIPKDFMGDFKYTCGIGDSEIKDLNVKKAIFQGGLGNIDIKEITFEDMRISQGVGDIDLKIKEVKGDLIYEGGVGDGDIIIPENSPVRFKTSSGLGSCRIMAKTSGEDKYLFKITSGIGDITIK